MTVEDIVVGERPLFDDIQWKMDFVPIRTWGLGLYSAVEVAFVAFRPPSWMLYDHTLRDNMIYDMYFYFDRYLYGLSLAILDFNFRNFTRKDTIPHKA